MTEGPPERTRDPIQSPLAGFNDMRAELLALKLRAQRLRDVHCERRVTPWWHPWFGASVGKLICCAGCGDWPCVTRRILDGAEHRDEMEEARRELFG